MFSRDSSPPQKKETLGEIHLCTNVVKEIQHLIIPTWNNLQHLVFFGVANPGNREPVPVQNFRKSIICIFLSFVCLSIILFSISLSVFLPVCLPVCFFFLSIYLYLESSTRRTVVPRFRSGMTPEVFIYLSIYLSIYVSIPGK